MEELRFSVDEEKYDDRRGQVLSLSGWCVSPGCREFRFRLLGDGREEICIPEAKRRARIAHLRRSPISSFTILSTLTMAYEE